MHDPLSVRRELLQGEIMPKLRDPVRESAILDTNLPDLITSRESSGPRRSGGQAPGQPL